MNIDIAWLNRHKQRLQHEFALNGYVSIPGFLDAAELTEANANKDRFVAEVVPQMPEAEVYYEDKEDPSTLKQLQQMWQHDRYFERMITAGGKCEILAGILLGEAVRPVNMQYFNKPPGVGQPTPPHQDGFYFHLVPNHAVTMWLALEDVEPEQGCVNYVQGSHKYGMRWHGKTGTLGFSKGIMDFGIAHDLDNAMAFPCKAGHLIAHHALTIHWADGNQSKDKTREALGFIYYAASCEENTLAKAEYQRQLDAALEAAEKI